MTISPMTIFPTIFVPQLLSARPRARTGTQRQPKKEQKT
jgi:hypothetical protein